MMDKVLEQYFGQSEILEDERIERERIEREEDEFLAKVDSAEIGRQKDYMKREMSAFVGFRWELWKHLADEFDLLLGDDDVMRLFDIFELHYNFRAHGNE